MHLPRFFYWKTYECYHIIILTINGCCHNPQKTFLVRLTLFKGVVTHVMKIICTFASQN